MAEEEEDIDIDIDIDGDDAGEPAVGVTKDAGNTDEKPIAASAHDNSSLDAKEGSRTAIPRTIGSFTSEPDVKDSKNESIESRPQTPLVDDFEIPDWVTQDCQAQEDFDTADMDEKSRAMIESMLAEEAFYCGRSTASTSNYKSSPSSSTTHKLSYQGSNGNHTLSNAARSQTWMHNSRMNAKLSSADLPSHNTRWTVSEDERLRQGIDLHGYGNWKAIAAIVGTRNPLQVKNHARHLAMSEKAPHDFSTNTSDGEALDRRSSAANSAEEDTGFRGVYNRRPRSKHVRRIGASGEQEDGAYMAYRRRAHRARSITSESGNEEFTGSEFGATSGYDTDNDEDRSTSKSPSFSARGGSRSSSARLTTPSPGLNPLYASLPLPHSISTQRTASHGIDDTEDIDVDIESTDEDTSSRLNLAENLTSFRHKSKSRSISPFSNSSTRSRLSSEFDSDSDRNLDNEDGDEIVESGHARKQPSASSPALSDMLGSSSELYTTPNFNTSTSSISSIGATSTSKHLLKDAQYSHQHQLQQQFQQKSGVLGHLYVDKAANSPKERRTVSFGAVHVAELKPDLNSYDEDDVNSSEDGGVASLRPSDMDTVMRPSPLSSTTYRRSTSFAAHSPKSNNTQLEATLTSIDRHSKVAHADLETDEDDEGSLGTGAKRNSGSGTSIAPAMTAMSTSVSPRILDKSVITEEEKLVHSEFFCNKASKTPERYQRIRNTILQAWEKSPSTYLTKTSVRSGLKDCGDVNAIGRVHSWLESIGAINVGMTASSPGASLARPRNGGNNSKRRGHSEERGWSSSSSSSAPRRVLHDISAELDGMESVWVTPPLRRRRVRNERGEWVDEKELEGHVIDHSVHTGSGGGGPERPSSRRSSSGDDLFSLDDRSFFKQHGMTKQEMEEELEQERLAAQNAKYFASTEMPVNMRVPKNRRAQHLLRQTRGFHDYEGDEESSGGYDPFRLVPLRKYSAQNPAPFRVKVSSDAMLIMDFHSHMAQTEVIGLLGGLYDEDERILFILGVFPCRSISTGLQCEMDPESDVEARYFFSSKGFVVVGWYHSHPTFEPNPSIRDIENQCEHQAMFRRHGTGVEPFVGVIVSPFDPRNLSFLSKFQFLTVSEEVDDHLSCRLPYGFDREITRTNELSVSVFQQLSELVRYYRTYEHRMDLSQPLRKNVATTRLEKLLGSLNHHIFVDESAGRAFLHKVRELVVRGFHLLAERGSSSPYGPLLHAASTPASSRATPTLSSLPTEAPPIKSTPDQPGVSEAIDRTVLRVDGTTDHTPMEGAIPKDSDAVVSMDGVNAEVEPTSSASSLLDIDSISPP
ncbi:hypothetical protein EDD11_007153 [Mortierella claussenii]|nr:hypothetical protein EDD11_007153 [Mortierella claussenii]